MLQVFNDLLCGLRIDARWQSYGDLRGKRRVGLRLQPVSPIVNVAHTQPVKSPRERQTHLGAVREQNMGSIAAPLDGGLVGWRRFLAHNFVRDCLKSTDQLLGVAAGGARFECSYRCKSTGGQ